MGNVPEADSLKPFSKATSRVRFAGLALDLDAFTLARESGEAIPLTRGEFAILRVFVARPGRVISRDTLLDALANRRFEPFDRSVDVLVGRLRRKIEPDPRRPSIIVTVLGGGYKFAAALCKEEPTTAPKSEETAVNSVPRPPGRRHMTVLCAELLPAEGRTLPTDLEDLHAAIAAFRGCVAEALALYGGAIGESHGREVVAWFGYPLAQENDAERAVRAALAIQSAVSELKAGNAGNGLPQLSARIGLEAGPVMVDSSGEALGNALTIATQVRAAAPPHSVLVTRNVQRQIAGLFVAEEQGASHFEDVAEPVSLYRIARASGGRRFGARMLTPLVGREGELDHLARRWERSRKGEGQFVLLVGEPGIGKSRLIHEFRVRLGEMPHTLVEWSSSQLFQNSPLHPIAEWGRQRFGADMSAERRFAALENTLGQMKLDPGENAPLLAPLLDIPLPQERAPASAPDDLRRRQLAALTAVVMASARVQPVVLVLEDLHWADPTTLDLLRGIAERGALAPLFVVAMARPEFRPPWSLRSHHSVLTLPPLDPGQVRQMVSGLASHRAFSNDVIDGVSERTGGVPLFVEEVTRLLLERGDQGGALGIPPSLQQSLMARLDRLGPAREVAQIGSVIGRGFSYGLLHALTGMANTALQAALEQLAEADILLVQGLPPDSDYRFKHALIQDAAYENLLISRRQLLHRRVAEILRDRFPDTAAAEPELLAHHFTQAGLTGAAIEWWGKAGEGALQRSAFQEAASHLGKAIEMADKADEGKFDAATASASASQRLKLQTDLGKALMWSRGSVAEEAMAAFIRARDLAQAIDNPTERFNTYYGLWIGNLVRGEFGAAREIAETFLREAERGALTSECAAGRRFLGHTCFLQGDFVAAQANLLAALSIYDPERNREARFRFGPDIGTAARAVLATTKWLLGEVRPTRALIEEAVAHAIETGHITTLAHTHLEVAFVKIFRGDAGAARRDAEVAIKLGQENAQTLWATRGVLVSAWASARLGNCDTGAMELRQALAALMGKGHKCTVPFFLGLLAEIEAEDDAAGALTRIDEALTLARATGEHWSDAFLHRLRGEILLRLDPANTASAEEAFLTAITVAQQQKARSFVLRAALGLARLYNSTNRSTDAHAMLASALEGFSPTPEFSEVAEAQALLVALRS
ncbi:MAG TPA: AAA family ATPase [Stellaceae bacterium]|nr:AAA family ATPase [Stellaceae bacterium]